MTKYIVVVDKGPNDKTIHQCVNFETAINLYRYLIGLYGSASVHIYMECVCYGEAI